ncbi:MAG: CDP-diacylglycerol--serine O-phosphatidyltransferase [Gammaproteobacteria bacterium]
MPKNSLNQRRGIYLLPNLFTTAALFSGFYAIVASINGRFEAAAIAIFIAMILDGMDGRVARMTNTQSDFGAEYDSLSDMISFGLAPALIIYQWGLTGFGRVGWVAAFVYTAAAALRLARFNTQVETADKNYFQGLPSPSAAGIVVALVWIGEEYKLEPSGALSIVAMVVTILAGILMISNVRYNSFKSIDLKGKVPFVHILAVVLVFVLVSLEPPSVLFMLFMAYALSGPVMTLFQLKKHRARRSNSEDSSYEEKG